MWDTWLFNWLWLSSFSRSPLLLNVYAVLRCHACLWGIAGGTEVVKGRGMEHSSFPSFACQSEYIMVNTWEFLALGECVYAGVGVYNENQMQSKNTILNSKEIRTCCSRESPLEGPVKRSYAFGPKL